MAEVREMARDADSRVGRAGLARAEVGEEEPRAREARVRAEVREEEAAATAAADSAAAATEEAACSASRRRRRKYRRRRS